MHFFSALNIVFSIMKKIGKLESIIFNIKLQSKLSIRIKIRIKSQKSRFRHPLKRFFSDYLFEGLKRVNKGLIKKDSIPFASHYRTSFYDRDLGQEAVPRSRTRKGRR